MYKILRHFVWILPGLMGIACNSGDAVNLRGAADSADYFPLRIGHYIDYQVDSVVFDDAPGGNRKDTVSFQLREEVVSYALTSLGDTMFYVHRFRRDSASMPWVLTDVWTAWYEENAALRKEENLIFQKMTFPLFKGLGWQATAYIPTQTSVTIGNEILEPYQYWESSVVSVDDSATVGSFTFPQGQVLQVFQVDSDDQLMKRFVQETYVRGLGLVFRSDSILDSRCIELGDFTPCLDKPWLEHASKGYILSQVIIDHN